MTSSVEFWAFAVLVLWANYAYAAQPLVLGAELVGCSCTKDCTGVPDGDYQACNYCKGYVRCTGGSLQTQLCAASVWNGNQCDASGSETCALNGVYYTAEGDKCWNTENQCKNAEILVGMEFKSCNLWCLCEKRHALGGSCISAAAADQPYTCLVNTRPYWQCSCKGNPSPPLTPTSLVCSGLPMI